MESETDSTTKQDTPQYKRTSFLQHRSHNISGTDDKETVSNNNSAIIGADSGFGSSGFINSYNNNLNVSQSLFLSSPSSSSSLISVSATNSTTTTPQKLSSSHYNSNLITIPENTDSDAIKLTPVTQNIRKILNIHITTPKSQDFQSTGIKRRSEIESTIDDYQSTPKKTKIDDLDKAETLELKGVTVTPLRNRNVKNRKRLLRNKLRSMPEDLKYLSDDDTENAGHVYGSQLTPVYSSYSENKRTPLSTSSSNLIQSSTPRSLSKLIDYPSEFDKSASVRKLLLFSDNQFEALLSSSSKEPESVAVAAEEAAKINVPKVENIENTSDIYLEDSFREYKKRQPIISSYKPSIPLYVPETKAAKRPFKRTLKFTYKSTDETPKYFNLPNLEGDAGNESDDGFLNESLEDYKTLYPMIDNVFRDRRKLKRQSSTARLIDIKRESDSILKSNQKTNRTSSIRKQLSETITRKEKTESKELKGFQEILGYVPSSTDLKITAMKVIADIHSVSGSDMDISSNSVKPLTACESLREINEKLLANPEVTCKLDSDLDVSKTSSVGSSMSIDKSPECKRKCVEPDNEKNQDELDISDFPFFPDEDFNAGICTPPRSQSPKGDNVLTVNFSEIDKFIPTTPKKMKQNSRSSIEYEKHEILYPSIPRTPTKNSCMSVSKHRGTSISQKHKASIIRDTDKRTRIYYDGFTNLNIIAKLEPYDLVLDKIFNMVSSQDLLNLSLVSKRLRNIVYSNSKARPRLLRHLGKCQTKKENVMSVERVPTSSKKMKSEIDRYPLKNYNVIQDRKKSVNIQKSPPVSPSKRKFHENQKIVKTLRSHEKLTKCPRCSRPSRILRVLNPTNPRDSSIRSSIATDSNGNHHNINTTFCRSSILKGYSIDNPTFHSDSTSFSFNNNNISNLDTPLNNNNNNSNFVPQINSQPSSSSSGFVPAFESRAKLIKSMSIDSWVPLPITPLKKRHQSGQLDLDYSLAGNSNHYAECTGILCKFRFCMDCLCEYHPGTVCKVNSNNSPTKDDILNGILQINSPYTKTSSSNSRSLKTRRKSLKRLCF